MNLLELKAAEEATRIEPRAERSFDYYHVEAAIRTGSPICKIRQKRFWLLPVRGRSETKLKEGEIVGCTIEYDPRKIPKGKRRFVAYHETIHQPVAKVLCQQKRSPLCNRANMEVLTDALTMAYTGEDESCCYPQLHPITRPLSRLVDPSLSAEENTKRLIVGSSLVETKKTGICRLRGPALECEPEE